VTRLLGGALVGAGHSVTIVTNERDKKDEVSAYRVLRRPNVIQLLKEYRCADAVIIHGAAARLGWPLLCRERRAVMVHHIKPGVRGSGPKPWLKTQLIRRTHQAAVSGALARLLDRPVEAILPNPYDETIFRLDSTAARDRDIVFVGRLIPEKGAHLLVEALKLLHKRGMAITATIVGDGPEGRRLRQLIVCGHLNHRIELAGQLTGAPLAQLLNRHRILVVPSLCFEAFGLVALEGIACGCVALGSRVGGVPEAIGPSGTTFEKGNAELLAQTLGEILAQPERIVRFRARSEQHLAKHRPAAVAARYLGFINGGGALQRPRYALVKEQREPREARDQCALL
jgi:glycosyltransferase involved in cell wall biosynthesis